MQSLMLRKLKTWLKSKARDLAYLISRNMLPKPRLNKSDSVLILPAADGWEGGGPYGFGDEMLMLGLLEGLKGKIRNIAALQTNTVGQRPQNIAFHGHSIKLIGFSNDWLSLSSYRQFIDIASVYSHFIVIGADILDGHYDQLDAIQRLRFVNLAAKMRIKAVITGCSFNGTSDQRIRNLFKQAENDGTVINARDNVSLARLCEFLQKVRGVADLAFLADTDKYPVSDRIKEIRNRAALWKDSGGIVIGINLCGWHIKDTNRFFDDFIEALLRLSASIGKLGLILLPHDTRTHALSDLDTLSELHRRLGSRIAIIGVPEDIESGVDAKQAVRCCDVLLTGRMHLAIAAHDQGVPAVSFAYQGKFEGFYALYGMGTEWMVDYDNVDGAVRGLHLAIAERQSLSANILEHKDKNKLLASLNLECIR